MSKEKVYYSWQERYPQELGLVRPDELRVLPDCAWIFPGTGEVLEKWRDYHIPVIVNTVVVSPNEGGLPLRIMSYLLGGIQTAQSLRRLRLNIDGLRVINPCYLNVYCDGGDINYQLSYGQSLITDLQSWMKRFFPDLSDVQLILDQGFSTISNDLLKHAQNYASAIDQTTYSQILERMINYSDQDDKIALYLSAHPLAWQYQTIDGLFITRNQGVGVVNYMPQSEMLFLTTMDQAGVQIDPLTSDVVTSVSRRIIHTPYYPLTEDEPILDWSVDANILQNTMTKLRRQSGHMHIAEILGCLGHIRAQIQ